MLHCSRYYGTNWDYTGLRKAVPKAFAEHALCSWKVDRLDLASLLRWTAEGASIITIEGVAEDGKLHPVQEAFVENGAVQCGFCTPGMILSSKALLDRNSQPTEDEIKNALAGNFWRCTGYAKILKAVQVASGQIKTAETD